MLLFQLNELAELDRFDLPAPHKCLHGDCLDKDSTELLEATERGWFKRLRKRVSRGFRDMEFTNSIKEFATEGESTRRLKRD